ncbi:MAG: UpxY family transcription antiterminator [Acidobacteria bacterium]|nr:UpxY family transcription antiterminator [Acidobacteriota bacterium]
MQSERRDGEWFAVRVRSNFESLTARSLDCRGVRCFVPMYKARRQWSDRVKVLDLPLFTGYVFCLLQAPRFRPILETPGVVQVVGTGTTPVPVEPHEMDALHRIAGCGSETLPWPYLSAGQRVRMRAGALKDVEGILATAGDRHRVVVNVELLQRSVAVSVERLDLEPIWPQ